MEDIKEYSQGLPSSTGGFGMAWSQLVQESVAKWELDTTALIDELFHFLRNEYWDNNREVWVSAGKPRVNEEGASAIIGSFRALLNANTFLSNIDEAQASVMAENYGEALADTLTAKCDDWQVDKRQLDLIITVFTNSAFLGLLRAKNEGERRYRTGYMSFEGKEQPTPSKQQTGIGWLNPFSWFKREGGQSFEGGGV